MTEPTPEAIRGPGNEFSGGCPVCGFTDGYLNVGRAHYFVCHVHRIRWHRGDNLFSSWRWESHADWESNWRQIAVYTEVDPQLAVDSVERRVGYKEISGGRKSPGSLIKGKTREE